MPDYFSTWLADGTRDVQINDRFMPMVLVKSVRLYENSFFRNTATQQCYADIQLPPGSRIPFVFFSSPAASDRASPVNLGNGYVRVLKWWNLPIQNFVDVYIFDQVQPASVSNIGFEVFDQSGRKVFDDDWHLLRIAKIINVGNEEGAPVFGANSVYWANSGVAGEIAVAKSTYRRAIVANGGIGGTWVQECLWVNSQTGAVEQNWVLVDEDVIGFSSYPKGWINPQPTKIYVCRTNNLPLGYTRP
ncbi:hypothetical protein [Kerstersia gyiorum]|uniref:Uncharacterized protein n=1 Tax=Kerstersia gyiorum TaxID=206506 RepID=A0A171KSI3_9BURK|nr:hypothetical protein [Kerstersia gyiorum]KKO71850.1 hypothetical protein AAV32_09790 [Kerstersia gyiorum]